MNPQQKWRLSDDVVAVLSLVVIVVVGGVVVDVPAVVAEGVVVVEADVTPILFPKPHDGSSEN